MISIPSDSRLFPQLNNSDIEGALYSTFNCDFDENQGVIRLGKRAVLNTSTDDVAEITSYPIGFKYFNNGSDISIYTAAGVGGVGSVFKALAPSGNFVKVVTASAPATMDSAVSDIETAFNELYFSSPADQKLYYLNASNVWAAIASIGSAGYPMMMCFMASRQKLYITKGGNIIQSINSDHSINNPSAQYTLTLSAGENISWIRSGSDSIWIGTVNITGDKGYVYQWDGSSPQYTKAYRLRSSGALACVIKDDIPWIIDSNGKLLSWNGGTFVPQTQFNRKNRKQLYNAAFNQNKRFIHPNGMDVIDDKIHILVDLTNNDAATHGGTQEECNPSGVYVYDEPTKSLRHRYGFGLTKSGGTIVDYGQERIVGVGGMAELIVTSNLSNGSILMGATFYKDAASSVSGMFYEDTADTLQKAGKFVSTFILAGSDGLTEAWNSIFGMHKKFLTATDRIVVKYRTYEDIPTEATITWTQTNAFNTATDLSAYAVGDEVDVIQGLGSGKCAHITNIQHGSGVWIVTVDETFVSAAGTSKARFGKWIKAGTIQDVKDFEKVPVLPISRKIQLKLWMLFTGKNELDGIMIPNKKQQQPI